MWRFPGGGFLAANSTSPKRAVGSRGSRTNKREIGENLTECGESDNLFMGADDRSNEMKKILLASAILMATTAAAHAGCGTSALNGTWRLHFLGGSTASADYIIAGGLINGPGLVNIPITQGASSCRVKFTVGASLFSGRSENVKGTDRKPHHIMMSGPTAGDDIFVMYRR
jgi:hypothetical protein